METTMLIVGGALALALVLMVVRMERLASALGRQREDGRDVRERLDAAGRLLVDLRARDEERRNADRDAREALKRLEATFLGASSRGRVGENVVWEALSVLPADMVDRDFRVKGKVVEFGIRLPDGRRLPVDAKWPAVAEVEALDGAEGEPRVRLAETIERIVARRAREVAKYLDASASAPFGVLAVPDAAYGVLRKAHLAAHAAGVLVVPYSSALPVLLALYSLCCRLGPGASDVATIVAEVRAALDGIERAVENQLERGSAMTRGAAAEIRVQVGRARGSLATGDRQDPAPHLRVAE